MQCNAMHQGNIVLTDSLGFFRTCTKMLALKHKTSKPPERKSGIKITQLIKDRHDFALNSKCPKKHFTCHTANTTTATLKQHYGNVSTYHMTECEIQTLQEATATHTNHPICKGKFILCLDPYSNRANLIKKTAIFALIQLVLRQPKNARIS